MNLFFPVLSICSCCCSSTMSHSPSCWLDSTIGRWLICLAFLFFLHFAASNCWFDALLLTFLSRCRLCCFLGLLLVFFYTLGQTLLLTICIRRCIMLRRFWSFEALSVHTEPVMTFFSAIQSTDVLGTIGESLSMSAQRESCQGTHGPGTLDSFDIALLGNWEVLPQPPVGVPCAA